MMNAPGDQERALDGYYGQPVLHEPVWTREIDWYFFAGGAAGASSALALVARLHGDRRLAATAGLTAAGLAAVSPPLLIADLGVPSRFHHMLRVFKVTSPMSVGSWVLALYVPCALGAAGLGLAGRYEPVQRLAEAAAGVLGPVIATYTAALLSDTAVPVWHESRTVLPVLFASSSAAAGGGINLAVLGLSAAGGPARRLTVAGSLAELVTAEVMRRRLGPLARPYHEGRARRYSRLATMFGLGALGLVTAGRHRTGLTRLAGLAAASASLCQRVAVLEAGRRSAADPRATIEPQLQAG